LAHGRVQVDHLDDGEAGETLEHLPRRFAFQGLFPALAELDDLAAHQVDAGNDHKRKLQQQRRLTGFRTSAHSGRRCGKTGRR